MDKPEAGRSRVVIERVTPEIDCGRFPIKRAIGEQVVVEADAFADGHDAITVMLLYREAGEREWRETPMEALVNDRWRGAFTVTKIGPACYTVAAYVDHFKSWARDMVKRIAADQVAPVDLETGARLIDAGRPAARGTNEGELSRVAVRVWSIKSRIPVGLRDSCAGSAAIPVRNVDAEHSLDLRLRRRRP